MAPVALKRHTAAQAARLAEIKLTCSRIREKARETLNASILQTRIDSINEIWTEARQAHAELMARDGIENDSYVTSGIFAQMQADYEDALDLFVTLREQLPVENRPTSRARSDSESDREYSRPAKLPRVDLPKFSGAPEDWESFCDSFTSLVHKVRGLDNSTKLQYLKSCLTGDAAEWAKEISTTNANYLSAWEELKERFYNPRVTVNNHLDALANLPYLTKESAAELCTLAITARRIVTALSNLKLPVHQWDIWLVHSLSGRLDTESRKLWEAELSKRDQLAIASARSGNAETDPLARFPTLREFTDFLIMRGESLKAAAKKTASTSKTPSNTRKVFHAQGAASQQKGSSYQCALCTGTHSLAKCPQFLSKPSNERHSEVRRLQRCFNCLGPHRVKACPSNGRCRKCQGDHHTLIHPEQRTTQNRNPSRSDHNDHKGGASASVGVHTASLAASKVCVILATAQVNVLGPRGTSTRARALLDQGSETTFVSEALAQLLELPRRRAEISLNGVGGSKVGTARATATLTLQSCHNPTYKITTEALVLPRLTSQLPSREIVELDLGCFSQLPLADPHFHRPAAIDLILGADLYGQLLRAGVKGLPSTRLVAQNTALGWIVSGAVAPASLRRAEGASHASLRAFHSSTEEEALQDSLQRFWQLEEIPQATFLKPEDEACERLYAETHTRDATGRYVVRLPLKGELPRVAAETRRMALSSLKHMHRRFSRESELARSYKEFMDAYEQLGHMSRVPTDDLDNPDAWYLPHHAVTNSTKLRVVFDASRQTSERHCLNGFLASGPPLQRDLSLILLNWRRYQYAFTADNVKMFRQIRVAQSDRNLQRIVWAPEPTIEPIDFYLDTVTYGTTSAPYLALRTLKQLAHDERSRFPLGAKCLEEDTYVDDTFAGDDELSRAIQKRDQLIGILGSGGIQLDKWAANHPDLLPKHVPQHEETPLKEIDRECSVKTLGLQWSPTQDDFRFSARDTETPLGPISKRTVLSNIARLFDPLGWLSPVTVIAKILMQDLWILKCDWDSALPPEAAERWRGYCDSLNSLPSLSVPRWLGTFASQSLQIHGFSDASSRAYAAAVYLRIEGSDGHYRARLLAAKTKVAPVKTVSIPNLELCGASLLVKLVCHLRTLDFLKASPIFLWSDSQVVLKWLSKHPCHWKTFVANRVSQIQTELPSAKWSHVPTKENPADIATRGASPADLRGSDLWWYGPPWLSLPSESWPQPPKATTVAHARPDTTEPAILERFSDLTTLIRVVAYCRRPLVNLRRRKSGQEPLPAHLTTLELAESRVRLIGLAQADAFATEISLMHAGKPLPKGSALRNLSPIMSKEEGILRVGGRLTNSPLSFERKHPPILPRNSALSRLFVRHAHRTMLHAGPTLTSAALMRQAWVIGARLLIKTAIHKCVKCQHVKPRVVNQMLGDLPAARVTPARPFTTSGIDYAGPFQVRTTKGRGYKAYKGYIALFVCFATRAIHLELVSDLTAASFIAAYKRFTSRRGVCQKLYSDNSTTFRGADNELRAMFNAASEFHKSVASVLANDGTSWYFIPPTTPHYGGIWEAGVKSTKHHLKRAFGEHTFTYEEFTTVLTEIEACLNSRPLCPLTSDIDDLNALTPAHFLIGSASSLIPDEDLTGVPENRLDRFRLMQRIRNQFWKRWSNEYLQNLQERGKWREPTENFAVGQLVLLRDDRYPPAKWPLGRVIEIHPGDDDLVRVVTVKTATGTFRRHIARLSPLSVDSSPRAIEIRPTDEGGRNVRNPRPLLEFLPQGKERRQSTRIRTRPCIPKPQNNRSKAAIK